MSKGEEREGMLPGRSGFDTTTMAVAKEVLQQHQHNRSSTTTQGSSARTLLRKI